MLSSSPCVRAITGLYLALGRVCFIKYPVLVVIRSRYNSGSPVTDDTAIRIDQLPCRGAPHYPTRSIPLAGHTFLGHVRPREINTSQPYLGLIERSARWSKSYARRGLGPSPIAHLHVAYAAGSRPSPLNTSAGLRSNAARAAQSLTSKRASADTTTPVAHILSHVAVSVYKVNDPTQIKYQDLDKRVIMK